MATAKRMEGLAMSPYGMTLRRLRESRGIDQKALAEKLSIGRSYLSRVELGSKPPLTVELMRDLVRVLSLTVEEKRQLAEAQAVSATRFQLPDGLTPMQVELANRFYQAIASLSPQQVSILNTQLVNESASVPTKPRIR